MKDEGAGLENVEAIPDATRGEQSPTSGTQRTRRLSTRFPYSVTFATLKNAFQSARPTR